jgi:hypothetical protein
MAVIGGMDEVSRVLWGYVTGICGGYTSGDMAALPRDVWNTRDEMRMELIWRAGNGPWACVWKFPVSHARRCRTRVGGACGEPYAIPHS